MPRKIRPRYGIDPVQEVQPFAFTDAQIECLFATLGPAKGGRHEIIAQLERCARDYIWLRNQNQEKPTRAEQNAALTEIGELAQGLGRRLRSLDMDTQWEVMAALPLLNANSRTDWIADCVDRIEDLEHAAEHALRTGKQRTGWRIQTHVRRTVERLANLYGELTNRPFSHNPNQLTKYDGEPHSRAGRFITVFFGIVDPDIPLTSISTAMASIVRARNARAQSAIS